MASASKSLASQARSILAPDWAWIDPLFTFVRPLLSEMTTWLCIPSQTMISLHCAFLDLETSKKNWNVAVSAIHVTKCNRPRTEVRCLIAICARNCVLCARSVTSILNGRFQSNIFLLMDYQVGHPRLHSVVSYSIVPSVSSLRLHWFIRSWILLLTPFRV